MMHTYVIKLCWAYSVSVKLYYRLLLSLDGLILFLIYDITVLPDYVYDTTPYL